MPSKFLLTILHLGEKVKFKRIKKKKSKTYNLKKIILRKTGLVYSTKIISIKRLPK